MTELSRHIPGLHPGQVSREDRDACIVETRPSGKVIHVKPNGQGEFPSPDLDEDQTVPAGFQDSGQAIRNPREAGYHGWRDTPLGSNAEHCY